MRNAEWNFLKLFFKASSQLQLYHSLFLEHPRHAPASRPLCLLSLLTHLECCSYRDTQGHFMSILQWGLPWPPCFHSVVSVLPFSRIIFFSMNTHHDLGNKLTWAPTSVCGGEKMYDVLVYGPFFHWIISSLSNASYVCLLCLLLCPNKLRVT